MNLPIYAIVSYGSKSHGLFQTKEEAEAAFEETKKVSLRGAYMMIREVATLDDLIACWAECSSEAITDSVHVSYFQEASQRYGKTASNLLGLVEQIQMECKKRNVYLHALDGVELEQLSY